MNIFEKIQLHFIEIHARQTKTFFKKKGINKASPDMNIILLFQNS